MQQHQIDSLHRLLQSNLPDSDRVMVLSNLGFATYPSDTKKARAYTEQSLALAQRIKWQKGIGRAYNVLGLTYRYEDNYQKALELYQTALSIRQQAGDSSGVAATLGNIGALFRVQGNYTEAQRYYEQTLAMHLRHNNLPSAAMLYADLAEAQWYLKDTINSLKNYQTSYTLAKKTNSYSNVMKTLLQLGHRYLEMGKLGQARAYLQEGLPLCQQLNDQIRLGEFYSTLGRVSLAMGAQAEAKRYLELSVATARAINNRTLEAASLLAQTDYFASVGAYREAYFTHRRHTHLKDSLFGLAQNKQLLEMQGRYNTEKKEIENQALRQQTEYAQSTSRLQWYVIGVGLLGFLGVVGLAVRLQRSRLKMHALNQALATKQHEILAQNTELQHQKEEIQSQRDAINEKNELLSHQNLKISQSIGVAQAIQVATLPSEPARHALLGEHFVLAQPRDVVSGDFYWAKAVGDQTILVVGDCTGHGVPGAFMALIGSSLLDRIVLAEHVTEPALILAALHQALHATFGQVPGEHGHNYGMDAAVCRLRAQAGHTQLSFAGARRPCLYVPGPVAAGAAPVHLLANTRLSVGSTLAEPAAWPAPHGEGTLGPLPQPLEAALHGSENPFKRSVRLPPGVLSAPLQRELARINQESSKFAPDVPPQVPALAVPADSGPAQEHWLAGPVGPVLQRELTLPAGSCFYLTSDGYTDQCNPQREKFGWLRLKNLLAASAHLPMNRQQAVLASALADFQGTAPQRDDIVVVGVRV
ncbi:MAG: tetratricopeptide repeat protein [Bernardetiaceae bacterium]|nr:tetratricopeptide repeat protein [Bernardetiaceae bacterium]